MPKEIKIVLKKNSEDGESNMLLADLLKKVLAMNDQVIKLIREKTIPGPKGPKGDSITGPQGDSIEGPPGPQGDKPIAGEDYSIPKDGKDGKDGESIKGDKGDTGKDAEDGSPDTPKQIITKLNTLEEQINVKSVRGLSEIITGLRRAIQSVRSFKGGGGMGDPVHQTFSGNGSLTSFTLSNNVAANGKAAWVYVNGQFQVNTTHWSISGKTLTLTFTPTSSETIDITYIRT